MYLKVESYPIIVSGRPVAHVMLKINPFNFKLKAEINIANGMYMEIKSNGESNEEFKDNIRFLILEKLKK